MCQFFLKFNIRCILSLLIIYTNYTFLVLMIVDSNLIVKYIFIKHRILCFINVSTSIQKLYKYQTQLSKNSESLYCNLLYKR